MRGLRANDLRSGLGHTGGTLDKLESIPGYNITPSNKVFGQVTKEAGVAIIGQTGDLAPADKRVYAVRDITATVDSIAMITASILSKKLAAGLDALVMDVKVGTGAFMPTYEASENLAQSIVAVANGAGTPTSALLTDMNQVLASNIGNALEVREAVQFLTGEYRNERLLEVTVALGAEMLMLSGICRDESEARNKLMSVLNSGQAAERFGKMVSGLGGPADFVEKYHDYLPTAGIVRPVMAPHVGVVTGMDTREIGMAIVGLGGGRRVASDKIDYSVGVSEMIRLGQETDSTTPLAVIHAQDEQQWQRAANQIQAAVNITGQAGTATPDIYRRIGQEDV